MHRVQYNVLQARGRGSHGTRCARWRRCAVECAANDDCAAQNLATTAHHSTLAKIACHDPRSDPRFNMYQFEGKAADLNHGHSSFYFVKCRPPFQVKSAFRRGEITCWAGQWIWLTDRLKCAAKS